jgi:hypothetical protein
VKRGVKEDLSKVRTEAHLFESSSSLKNDRELKKIQEKLNRCSVIYDKTPQQLADIFCKVSGNLDNFTRYLKHE